jgi:hypothetical protein
MNRGPFAPHVRAEKKALGEGPNRGRRSAGGLRRGRASAGASPGGPASGQIRPTISESVEFVLYPLEPLQSWNRVPFPTGMNRTSDAAPDPAIDPDPIVYRIDDDFRITYVNAAWQQFAEANSGESVMGDKLLGKSLWACIAGASLRSIYRSLIDQARKGQPVSFNCRCDGPDQRRWLAGTMRHHFSGDVEISWKVIKEEARNSVKLLKVGEPRSQDFVKICSWCNLVKTSPNEWTPIEQALRELNLLEEDQLPQVTHAICPTCQEEMMKEIQQRGRVDS